MTLPFFRQPVGDFGNLRGGGGGGRKGEEREKKKKQTNLLLIKIIEKQPFGFKYGERERRGEEKEERKKRNPTQGGPDDRTSFKILLLICVP